MYIFPLNYCGGIFFKYFSYLYEVVRTNFSAYFETLQGRRALGCAKFCLNRRKDVGMRPKNIKNLHLLVISPLARANPFIDF